MKNRIKQIRQSSSLGLSQEAFGKRLGVTGAAISRIENGSREPSDQIILAVCREFNVNETWLRTGEGEMFSRSPETVSDILAKDFNLTELERRIISAYLQLNDNDRMAVQRYVQRVIDSAAHPSIVSADSPATDQNPLSELVDVQNGESDIVAELAELKRQNQALAAKVAAMEEEDAAQEPTQANAG